MGKLHRLDNFILSHREESSHVPTENRKGQLTKARPKAIGKRVRVGHGNDTVQFDRVHRIPGAGRLAGKNGHAWPECLCRKTKAGEQSPPTDWRKHHVKIRDLIEHLNHHRPLSGYHKRIVKGVNHDRPMFPHEFEHLCIGAAPIVNHMHLSPIAQNRTILHESERLGHYDMRDGSAKATGQCKPLPMIP